MRTCTCGTPVDDQRVICQRCETQLSHHLADQESHREELTTALTRQVRMNAPNDGGRGSDLTLAWKRMGDRFLDTIETDEVRAILATLPPARAAADALHAQRNLLVSWCRLLHEEMQCDLPRHDSVRALSLHLERHLGLLHTHEAAVELVAEVKDWVWQMWRTIDKPKNRTRFVVGPCPEDTAADNHCFGDVMAIVPDDEASPATLECTICSAEWKAGWGQWKEAGARIMARKGQPVLINGAPYLTIPDAARITEVHEKRMRRAINAGNLPAFKVSPRKTLIRLDIAEAWRDRIAS